MRTFLIALLLALQGAPAPFSARWDSATSATLAWGAAGRACLYREPVIGQTVFLGCYDGPQTLQLGHTGPLDAAYRPTGGDVFALDFGDHTERARLMARAVYLPLFR